MQDKVKILVFLAVWKRPEITELCFQGIQRLQKHPDFDIQALAVISELEMIPLCEKYNINFVLHENSPLGRKKNKGLARAKSFEFDYLMEIGSDDLVLNDLLDAYKPLIGKYDFFGIRDLAYLNSETGECRRYTSMVSTYGAGRMISRKALEKMKWRLWLDRLNRGLDNNSVFAMVRGGVGYRQVLSGEFPMVIDVKSKINLWSFNPSLGVAYNADLVIEKLSIQEQQTLGKILQCQPVE
jgi:glycosyltransferase involved in cell wall biosynthesis